MSNPESKPKLTPKNRIALAAGVLVMAAGVAAGVEMSSDDRPAPQPEVTQPHQPQTYQHPNADPQHPVQVDTFGRQGR